MTAATTVVFGQVQNIAPDVPKRGQVFKHGQWEEAKKKCEHAQSAITVDWSDGNNRGYMDIARKLRKPGEIIQVCIQPKCKLHPKTYERTAKAESSAASKAAQEARQKKIHEERSLENQLRMGWAITAISKVKTIPDAVLRWLVMSHLTYGSNEDLIQKHMCKDPRSRISNADVAGLDFAQAVSAVFIAQSGLHVQDWCTPDHDREKFVAALKLFGVNARPAWDKPKTATAKQKKAAAKPAKKKAAKR